MNQTRDNINVSCCIIINKTKILILRRKHKGPRDGLWEFPGGKQENETSEECAIRETFEEIEYKIDEIRFLTKVREEYKDTNIELTAFLAFSDTRFRPSLKVHDDYKWEQSTELHKYPFPEANKKVIDLLIKDGY